MQMPSPVHAVLRCLICRQPFDFKAHEAPVVLRHVAYGYDFAHPGRCLAAAQELLFPEPGYDCAAFGPDPVRRRVLELSSAGGWAAVVPNTAEQILAGRPVQFEPLRYWALVERADGSRSREGIVWDAMWLAEPGGAEFPAARRGRRAPLGYAPLADRADLARLAEWAALLQARGRQVAAVQPPAECRAAA